MIYAQQHTMYTIICINLPAVREDIFFGVKGRLRNRQTAAAAWPSLVLKSECLQEKAPRALPQPGTATQLVHLAKQLIAELSTGQGRPAAMLSAAAPSSSGQAAPRPAPLSGPATAPPMQALSGRQQSTADRLQDLVAAFQRFLAERAGSPVCQLSTPRLAAAMQLPSRPALLARPALPMPLRPVAAGSLPQLPPRPPSSAWPTLALPPRPATLGPQAQPQPPQQRLWRSPVPSLLSLLVPAHRRQLPFLPPLNNPLHAGILPRQGPSEVLLQNWQGQFGLEMCLMQLYALLVLKHNILVLCRMLPAPATQQARPPAVRPPPSIAALQYQLAKCVRLLLKASYKGMWNGVVGTLTEMSDSSSNST